MKQYKRAIFARTATKIDKMSFESNLMIYSNKKSNYSNLTSIIHWKFLRIYKGNKKKPLEVPSQLKERKRKFLLWTHFVDVRFSCQMIIWKKNWSLNSGSYK